MFMSKEDKYFLAVGIAAFVTGAGLIIWGLCLVIMKAFDKAALGVSLVGGITFFVGGTGFLIVCLKDFIKRERKKAKSDKYKCKIISFDTFMSYSKGKIKFPPKEYVRNMKVRYFNGNNDISDAILDMRKYELKADKVSKGLTMDLYINDKDYYSVKKSICDKHIEREEELFAESVMKYYVSGNVCCTNCNEGFAFYDMIDVVCPYCGEQVNLP